MTKLVLPTGPESARILLVGEAPGQEEYIQGRPFVGKAGWQLDGMLRDAGIDRSACRITNAFLSQPPSNNLDYFISKRPQDGWLPYGDRYVRPDRAGDLAMLAAEILAVNPNIIIALGATPLWALWGSAAITNMRGNLFEVEVLDRKFKMLPTFHPAYIERSYAQRPIAIHDLRRAASESGTPTLAPRDERFILRPSWPQAMATLDELLARAEEGPLELCGDLETRGGHIACIGLAWTESDAICIPFMCVERREGYWSNVHEEMAVIGRLQQLLCHPNVRLIGQNLLYDLQYIIAEWFFRPKVWRDTMLLQHAMFPNMRKALDFLVTLYAKQPRYWKVDGKTWERGIPEEQLWVYNCRDCVYTLEVCREMERICKGQGCWPQFEFLMGLYEPVLDMMLRGIRVDESRREQFGTELVRAIEQRQKDIDYLVDRPLNVGSHKQMSQLFYDDFGMTPIFKRAKKGVAPKAPTVDDEALDKMSQREPLLKPLIRMIRDVRSMRVYKSNFIDQSVSPHDGRMRCSFNITGTVTYRFSSSANPFDEGGNLQNNPRETNAVAEYLRDHGGRASAEEVLRGVAEKRWKQKDIDEALDNGWIVESAGAYVYEFVLPATRKIFVPDPDYTIIDMDLDRADLQVVAWRTGDEVLKQLLRSGVDMHAENAKVVGLDRQEAKVFCHGTNYGGKPRTMAANCGITVAQAERGQQRWFAEHPGIKEWHNEVEGILRSGRPMIRNPLGFRCFFYDRPDACLGEALAWEPQSVVALVINSALTNIYRELPAAQPLLQVHDSLVMQGPTPQVPVLIPQLEKLSLIPVPYPDELVIPVSFKTSQISWGDCH